MPTLLEVWSRTPTRTKSWPEGRSICWEKLSGSLLATVVSFSDIFTVWLRLVTSFASAS